MTATKLKFVRIARNATLINSSYCFVLTAHLVRMTFKQLPRDNVSHWYIVSTLNVMKMHAKCSNVLHTSRIGKYNFRYKN